MIWPFKRRRKHRDEPPSQQFEAEVIPVYDTEYEDIVVALLERAREESLKHGPNEEFTVLLTDEEWERCGSHIPITLAVFARAGDYGLMPEWSFNEEFAFSVPTY